MAAHTRVFYQADLLCFLHCSLPDTTMMIIMMMLMMMMMMMMLMMMMMMTSGVIFWCFMAADTAAAPVPLLAFLKTL
jgi:hypothetical protein